MLWTLATIFRSASVALCAKNNEARMLAGAAFMIFWEKAMHFIGAGDLVTPKTFLLWGAAVSLLLLAIRENRNVEKISSSS